MSDGKEITKVEGKEIEHTRERPAVIPPVDIFENEDEVLVVADVPGVASDGVTLSFENDQLTIEATTTLPGNLALRPMGHPPVPGRHRQYQQCSEHDHQPALP